MIIAHEYSFASNMSNYGQQLVTMVTMVIVKLASNHVNVVMAIVVNMVKANGTDIGVTY